MGAPESTSLAGAQIAVGGRTRDRSRVSIAGAVRHTLLLLATFIALAPGFFMFTTALKSQDEYVFDKVGLPDVIVLENFRGAVVDNPFFLWMRNSAILAVGAVLLSTFVACLAAYAISRMRFRGKDVLLAISTALMVVPPVVMIVPLFVLYTQLGLISTFHGTVIIYAGLITPFSVYLLVSFFRTLPTEILEAALIDGASPLGVLMRVVIPLSGPPLVTLFVVNALYVWNDLLIALIFLQNDESRTLMAGLSVFQGRYNNQIPLTMAGMVMASMPMIILYIIFQRYFIRGLTAGALK
jgi:ABC-type glycerol-3-phosphate transport system permease component